MQNHEHIMLTWQSKDEFNLIYEYRWDPECLYWQLSEKNILNWTTHFNFPTNQSIKYMKNVSNDKATAGCEW